MGRVVFRFRYSLMLHVYAVSRRRVKARVHEACQVNVHVHTLKASKAKGLFQLVSRNDPQSCILASTRDRVERSLARRNRIKSGIATRFKIPGV